MPAGLPLTFRKRRLSTREPPRKKTVWSLRSRAVRGWLYQALALAAVAAVVAFLAHNTQVNMRERGIQASPRAV